MGLRAQEWGPFLLKFLLHVPTMSGFVLLGLLSLSLPFPVVLPLASGLGNQSIKASACEREGTVE